MQCQLKPQSASRNRQKQVKPHRSKPRNNDAGRECRSGKSGRNDIDRYIRATTRNTLPAIDLLMGAPSSSTGTRSLEYFLATSIHGGGTSKSLRRESRGRRNRLAGESRWAVYAPQPWTLSILAFASAPRRASPLASCTLWEPESADAPSRGRIAGGQSHGDDRGGVELHVRQTRASLQLGGEVGVEGHRDFVGGEALSIARHARSRRGRGSC